MTRPRRPPPGFLAVSADGDRPAEVVPSVPSAVDGADVARHRAAQLDVATWGLDDGPFGRGGAVLLSREPRRGEGDLGDEDLDSAVSRAGLDDLDEVLPPFAAVGVTRAAKRSGDADRLVAVADTLGIPDGTARSRLHYATRALRAAFEAARATQDLREGRPA